MSESARSEYDLFASKYPRSWSFARTKHGGPQNLNMKPFPTMPKYTKRLTTQAEGIDISRAFVWCGPLAIAEYCHGPKRPFGLRHLPNPSAFHNNSFFCKDCFLRWICCYSHEICAPVTQTKQLIENILWIETNHLETTITLNKVASSCHNEVISRSQGSNDWFQADNSKELGMSDVVNVNERKREKTLIPSRCWIWFVPWFWSRTDIVQHA